MKFVSSRKVTGHPFMGRESSHAHEKVLMLQLAVGGIGTGLALLVCEWGCSTMIPIPVPALNISGYYFCFQNE
jgi:hypothetical protein